MPKSQAPMMERKPAPVFRPPGAAALGFRKNQPRPASPQKSPVHPSNCEYLPLPQYVSEVKHAVVVVVVWIGRPGFNSETCQSLENWNSLLSYSALSSYGTGWGREQIPPPLTGCVSSRHISQASLRVQACTVGRGVPV